MKRSIFSLLALFFVMITPALAQEESYATIPSGTDLNTYFSENPIPESAKTQLLIYELEAGGEYTVSDVLDFDAHRVTLRTNSKDNHAKITYTTENSGITTTAQMGIKYINFDCAALPSNKGVFAFSKETSVPAANTIDPATYKWTGALITDPIVIASCNFDNVGGYFFWDNMVNTWAATMLVDNCVVHLTPQSAIAGGVFWTNKAGQINDLTISNSTFYEDIKDDDSPADFKYFYQAGLYKAPDLYTDYAPERNTATNTLTYSNCTFYHVTWNNGQWGNYNGMQGRAYSYWVMTNCIFYDCSTSGSVPRRFLHGKTYTDSPGNKTFLNNTYMKNDGTFQDPQNYDESGTNIEEDPHFADPANGDFHISNSKQADLHTGDPRWCGGPRYAEAEVDGLLYYLDRATMTAAVMQPGIGNYYQQENITIPSAITYEGQEFTVNEMQNEAFAYSPNLTTITIPSTVTTIGNSAFNWCDQLTEVVLPDGLAVIPEMLFYQCRRLASINIPSSVTTIGEMAFYNCPLTAINLPQNLKEIGDNAFYGCKFTQVELPQGVETIGEYAFYSGVFTEINIPTSVTSIGAFAFRYVQQSFNVDADNANYSSQDGILFNKDKTTLIQAPLLLDGSYTVPATVTTICQLAFNNCKNLTSIILPEGLTTIEDRAFYYSGLTGELSVPASVANEHWWEAFYYCPNLSGINIAEGNTIASSDHGVVYNKEKTQLVLMPQAFDGDYSILPTTTSIGYYQSVYDSRYDEYYYYYDCAISNCAKLTSLHIPASVTTLVVQSLRNNPMLSTITVDESSEHFMVVDGVLFDKQQKVLYWFPDTYEGSYTIPDGVEGLTREVFANASKLQHVTVPSSVSKLSYNTFNCCTLDDITWKREEPLNIWNSTREGYEYEYTYNYARSLFNCFIRYQINSEGEGEYADCTLYVPEGSVNAYKNDNSWGYLGFNIQPISTTNISEYKESLSLPSAYYTIDGRKLKGKPTKSGVYINGGKKIVIK